MILITIEHYCMLPVKLFQFTFMESTESMKKLFPHSEYPKPKFFILPCIFYSFHVSVPSKVLLNSQLLLCRFTSHLFISLQAATMMLVVVSVGARVYVSPQEHVMT